MEGRGPRRGISIPCLLCCGGFSSRPGFHSPEIPPVSKEPGVRRGSATCPESCGQEAVVLLCGAAGQVLSPELPKRESWSPPRRGTPRRPRSLGRDRPREAERVSQRDPAGEAGLHPGPAPQGPPPPPRCCLCFPGRHGPRVPRKYARRCAFDPLETSILKNDSSVVKPSKLCCLQKELVMSDSSTETGTCRALGSGWERGRSPPPSALRHTCFRWMSKRVCLFQHVSDLWGWLSGSRQGLPCRQHCSRPPGQPDAGPTVTVYTRYHFSCAETHPARWPLGGRPRVCLVLSHVHPAAAPPTDRPPESLRTRCAHFDSNGKKKPRPTEPGPAGAHGPCVCTRVCPQHCVCAGVCVRHVSPCAQLPFPRGALEAFPVRLWARTSWRPNGCVWGCWMLPCALRGWGCPPRSFGWGMRGVKRCPGNWGHASPGHPDSGAVRAPQAAATCHFWGPILLPCLPWRAPAALGNRPQAGAGQGPCRTWMPHSPCRASSQLKPAPWPGLDSLKSLQTGLGDVLFVELLQGVQEGVHFAHHDFRGFPALVLGDLAPGRRQDHDGSRDVDHGVRRGPEGLQLCQVVLETTGGR
uniref:Uncharacterized protein n=1 Tax=Mustela putorius furo TaxID=9669 RepID=M3Z869_MUSPF